ncbi:MAG: glycosyltransferase [Planctomycetota bacterium]
MPLRISLITPACGARDKILETIKSVVAQELADVEYVVIGNVAPVQAALPAALPRAEAIRWIASETGDCVQLINEGVRQTTAPIVAWLLPGDLYFDDTIALAAQAFHERTDAGVVYGDVIEVDENGKSLRALVLKPFTPERLQRGLTVSQPAAFVRRSALATVGDLDGSRSRWADYDLWIRLAKQGVHFHHIPRSLAAQRLGAGIPAIWTEERFQDGEAVEQLNDLLVERYGGLSRSNLVRTGVSKACAEIPAEAGFFRLVSAAYRHAGSAAERWNGVAGLSIWNRLLLARRTIKAVLRHRRRVGKSNDRQAVMQPRRFQFLRRRMYRLVHHSPRPLAIPAMYGKTRPPDDPPVVSIVTPSYNQAPYLEATLRSVLDQNYPRLEYIVQDGGSTDGSVDILRRYSDRLNAWESKPDGGQADAVNLGMQRTTGEIMAYLNSDDLLLPGSIAYAARYFAEHPEVDVIYGHRVLIDERGDEIGRWVLPPHDNEVIKYADFIPQETMFWRRRAWERVGARFDESFRFALDWDLILRFQAAGLRFERLPRFLGAFRITEAQKTQSSWLPIGRREVERLWGRVLGSAPDYRTIKRRMRSHMRQHLLYDKLYLLGLLRY